MTRCRWNLLAAVVAILCLAADAAAISEPPQNRRWLEAGEFIFLTDEVSVVEITMETPGDFAAMLANPESNDQKRATIRWRNSLIDEVVEDVAIRPRGNTSRMAVRKSWKLDFNDFVPGRNYRGLEAININGEVNDPTFLRRMLVHEFQLRMGLPAQRTHYVAMYVDDTGDGEFVYRALKVHTEHVDEEFTNAWFGSKTGNLYKCNFKGDRADLVYRPQLDYAERGGGLTYEEKNNRPDSDYTDLVEFIDFINNAPPAEVFTGLEHSLNIDNFLRYLATNVAVGSWDDYWYGSNNYYLYSNPESGRFEWIPFDYDNVLGIDFFNVDWSTRHFDRWGEGGFGTSPAPLVDAVFNHSAWRRQFRRYLLEAVAILEDPEFQGLVDEYHALILPWFDGTIEDGGVVGTITQGNQHEPHFLQYNEPDTWSGGSFHTLGVMPFIERRAASLREQIDSFVGATFPNPPVHINEVMASNATTIADNTGAFEDWIELYNAGDAAVDLTGWHLTDKLGWPTRYVIPDGTVIGPGGYLLVWASGAPERTAPDHVHTNFALASGGEAVGLFHREGEGRVLVDWTIFPALLADDSWGRLPDGTGPEQVFFNPTPGAPNDGSGSSPGEPRDPPRVFINEFMASNGGTIADRFGDFPDWVELYNDEGEAVDLAGMYLTDNLANPTKWQFPDGAVIPAKGFLLVWADNQPELTGDGHYHAAFALSASGEALGLFDTDANLRQPVHTHIFGPQERDVSEGLLPDGQEPFRTLDQPTPGTTNVLPLPFEMLEGWLVQ